MMGYCGETLRSQHVSAKVVIIKQLYHLLVESPDELIIARLDVGHLREFLRTGTIKDSKEEDRVAF